MNQKTGKYSLGAMFTTATSRRSLIVITQLHAREAINDSPIMLNQCGSNDKGVTMLQ